MKQVTIRYFVEQEFECEVMLKDDMTEDQINEAFYNPKDNIKVTLEEGCSITLEEYCQDNAVLTGCGSMELISICEVK